MLPENYPHRKGETMFAIRLPKAIKEFLEDQEDYLLTVAVLEKKNKTISLEELGEKLGLVNKNRRRG
ncbi:MAG TPA: hypothetical protein VGV92_02635 [Gammaproteobacteria bacterium]|nr:hypothetical protein [Gammaproteobacteria bacterium]